MSSTTEKKNIYIFVCVQGKKNLMMITVIDDDNDDQKL